MSSTLGGANLGEALQREGLVPGDDPNVPLGDGPTQEVVGERHNGPVLEAEGLRDGARNKEGLGDGVVG
jgi:hypothetical protein